MQREQCKIEVELNNFCDMEVEEARALTTTHHPDHFLPDQKCGVICRGKRLHGGLRKTITQASHADELHAYTCGKHLWTAQIFRSVD